MDFIQKLKPKINRWRQNPAAFWIAILFLNSLLLLPEVILFASVHPLLPIPPLHGPQGWYGMVSYFFRRENQDFFRIIADFYVLLSLFVLPFPFCKKKNFRRILLLVYFFLFTFQVYDVGMLVAFGKHPILYNDIRLLMSAAYLAVDISFSHMLLNILGIILLAGGILTVIPFLFKIIADTLQTVTLNRFRKIAGILVGIYVFASTLWFGFNAPISTVHWIFPKFLTNLAESSLVYSKLKKIHGQPVDSTYYHYRNIDLNQKPDIYLLMIESYGKILVDQPELRPGYQKMMHDFQDSLTTSGWSAVTNYSRSPISGGLSWLSIGTVFYGMKIKDQAIYTYMMNQRNHLPGLLQFFQHQGYHTFNLQPLNRVRAGYSLEKYQELYNFDVPIYFEDLNFEADQFGFGFMPDQYSLNYATEKFLKPVPPPRFLFFITISSHYPWNFIPTFEKNWPLSKFSRNSDDQFSNQLKRAYHRRIISKQHYVNYLKVIEYELRVVFDYISRTSSQNSVFIILGDHQPPLITRSHPNFFTPIHIVSKNRNFLQIFEKYGFTNGLLKTCEDLPTVKHQGIYSMLVRALVINDTKEVPVVLPPYKPEGISLSIIQ